MNPSTDAERPMKLTRRKFDRRIVDEAFEAYLQWRGECIALERAYGLWSSAAPREARGAFWGYRAALEREEHAARRYGRLLTACQGGVPRAAAAA
jgi:hypothetical protein